MSSMIAGKEDRNGFRWVRCEVCGDSRKSWKAHKLIDKKGSTYCLRCGHSSHLSIENLISLVLGDKSIDEVLDEQAGAIRTPKQVWNRAPLLPQYEIEDEPDWVSFEMRDANGNRVGWHNRNMREKQCDNDGKRGIGYVGRSLVSSPSRPLIVVEGPADVLTERDVCVFGAITRGSAKWLRLQYAWLFPDPDQLDSRAKRRRFVERVVVPMIEEGMVIVQGVIVGNDDPDVATKKVHVPVDELEDFSHVV